MTKKTISIITSILCLGALSLYFNRDWFAPELIQVSHRSVSPRGAAVRGAAKIKANPVVFLINKELRLTSVRVVVVSDAETNKYPHPIWNLISDSNSVPIKEFVYGTSIHGMRLAVKGVGPDPLEPGVNYRLLLDAGSTHLNHDFVPVPRTQ